MPPRLSSDKPATSSPPIPLQLPAHLEVELSALASTSSDPQRDVLQTLLEWQKAMIEKQLQCVTQQDKPLLLPPSKSLLPSVPSSEHPAPSEYSPRQPSPGIILKIYKELDRLLNQLRDWEDVFQKSLSEHITSTGDVSLGTGFMKEVGENQKGVWNLVDEYFKHRHFKGSFPRQLPSFEEGNWHHSLTRYKRIQAHYQHLSGKKGQLKVDISKGDKLLCNMVITETLPSYKRILSGMLSIVHPIIEELEQKQTKHMNISPAHVIADKFLEGVKMEMMEMEWVMMEVEWEMSDMDMEMESEAMVMFEDGDRSMETVAPGQVSMVHQSKEQLGESKNLDLLDLISEYHAVTWEQIRTLCFLPLRGRCQRK